jgi:hypothetical protein
MPFWTALGSKIYKKNPTITSKYEGRVKNLGGNFTIERMTTQGRFNAETIACDNVDFPDPELPAIPIIVTSAHGGE